MDTLRLLVQEEGGELNRLTRAALGGFLATLEAGLHMRPDDPAAATCQLALTELHSLLTVAGLSLPKGNPASAPADATTASVASTPWKKLLDIWNRSKEWQTILGNPVLASENIAKELWLLTLRLPPASADAWQREWQQSRGDISVAPQADVLAGPQEQLLVPASEASQHDVRLAPQAALPAELAQGTLGKFAQAMATPVAACMAWIEHDLSLRHVLRSLFRFGSARLADGHRNRFQNALMERFENLKESEADADANRIVIAWVALDETIHSLLHLPPAHPQSAFAGIGRASRGLVAEVRDFAFASGLDVHLQVLSGRYSELRGYTEPDADVETAEGVAPGEVALCTRLFVRLNGKNHPGRVVYRPR